MSWKISGIVKSWTHTPSGRRLTRPEKMFLLLLSDYSDDETGLAWPSVKRIAKECLCSERTIQNVTRTLSAAKLLEVKLRPHQTNVYKILIEQEVLYLRGANDAPGEIAAAPGGEIAAAPQPSLNRQNLKTPLPPASGGTELLRWSGETIQVHMGRRRRLPNLQAYAGAQARDVANFLCRHGIPARVVEAA